jgi:GntR family transcriptional regulator, transcriptional repressor for pyruvate dehydrogenase complex
VAKLAPVATESEGIARALRPVRRSRLYEELVERLRELIDVQGLEPGDRLMSERDLAERLGVSRTSVRQALTALEVMGLVRIRHRGGSSSPAPGTPSCPRSRASWWTDMSSCPP